MAFALSISESKKLGAACFMNEVCVYFSLRYPASFSGIDPFEFSATLLFLLLSGFSKNNSGRLSFHFIQLLHLTFTDHFL